MSADLDQGGDARIESAPLPLSSEGDAAAGRLPERLICPYPQYALPS